MTASLQPRGLKSHIVFYAMAFYYAKAVRLRSILAKILTLLLFIQAYSSILAGILSFCLYVKSTEAKSNFSKNVVSSNEKNNTQLLHEAEAETGKDNPCV